MIKNNKNNEKIIFDSLNFQCSIEKTLFSKFFGVELLPINKLIEKLGYKKIDDIKLKTNKNLFYNIMKKVKIDTNSNVLLNIKKVLSKNGEKNFVKILDFIEKIK